MQFGWDFTEKLLPIGIKFNEKWIIDIENNIFVNGH